MGQPDEPNSEGGLHAGPPDNAPGTPNPWLVGNDLEQARKRILWGGVAGLVVAGILLIVVTTTYFADPETMGVVQPSRGQFLYVLLEAGIMAALSVGVLNRSRWAAAGLLAYHILSKLALFALALFGLAPGNLNPYSMTIFLLIPAYLFFQALRGALTWHYLTHPVYPARRPNMD